MNRFQPVGRTKVLNGTILSPEMAGLRFVLSLNNLAGKVEGNPLLPLFDKKWKKVREDSKGWYATKTGAYKLGAVSTLAVQSDTWVVHMLCQDQDLKVDLDGLKTCLNNVCKLAKSEQASVHVSSLLVDAVPQLSDLCTECLVNNGVSVYYYNEAS
jgi:hypothetical protein